MLPQGLGKGGKLFEVYRMKISGAFIEIDPETKRILSVYIHADSDIDEQVVLEILKPLEKENSNGWRNIEGGSSRVKLSDS